MSASEAPLFTRGDYAEKFHKEGRHALARAFAGHEYSQVLEGSLTAGIFFLVAGAAAAALFTAACLAGHTFEVGLFLMPATLIPAGLIILAVGQCKMRRILKEEVTQEMFDEIMMRVCSIKLQPLNLDFESN